MQVQPLQHNDLPLINALLPPGWDSAIPSIHFYTTSAFCFPFKVMIDNKLAGTGTAIIHHDVAWLAHIIVHPDFRNQGIGRRITQSLVEFVHAKGLETMYLLATELGEPLYSKLGFEPESEYLFFKGEMPSKQSINKECIVPYDSAYENQISSLDGLVSGEDRMFHLRQHLSNGLVYQQDNIVEGYYLPTLGDGLIIATTSAAGQALMKLRLTTKDFAVFPMDNIHAVIFFQQHSFTEIRRQKRMRLGKKRNWQPEHIYNRIGGNLG